MTGPSAPVTVLLRVLLTPARAEAAIGDIREELAMRVDDDQAPRWPRAWVEGQAWRIAGAAGLALVPKVARSTRFVVRDAWRALRATPAAAASILLVLTISIAAATVTFSVVDTVVLRALPFDDADQLVRVSGPADHIAGRIAAPQEYLAWQAAAPGFAGLAAVRVWSDRIGATDDAPPIVSAMVTASLFDVLRVRPALGAPFAAMHEVAGREDVVVLGHDLWRRMFSADPGIVGRTITIGRYTPEGTLVPTPVTVLAVMPEGFTYPVGRENPVELWRPYVFSEQERALEGGIASYLHVVGRLRPGVGATRAEAEILAATAPVAAAFPRAYADWRPSVVSLYDSLVAGVRGWMLLVLYAVALVLAVACVNVANLLLVRAARRSREVAIRGALGASRKSIIGSLLAESLLLSGAAAAMGLLVATWGIGVARGALPAGIARAADISLDFRVVVAAVTAAVVTGLFFGAVPAWQASRADVASLLRGLSGTLAGARQPWRSAFLVAQVAFVGILMVATTLFVSSFIRIVRADLGFDRSHLISIDPMGRFTGTPDDVVDTLRAIPGVEAVARISRGPAPLVTNASASYSVWPAGADEGARPVSAEFRVVSADYFTVAGVPLLGGRSFVPAIDAGTTPIVVDELLARAIAGDRDPVGLHVRVGQGTTPAIIIGLVRNVRLNGPEGVTGPQVYLTTEDWRGARHLVRTAIDPARVAPVVQDRLASIGADGTPPSVTVLEEAFGRITSGRRFNAALMSIFGAIALFIGAAGIFGVMASTVAERTREIGVRVALGATAARIMRDVLARTVRYLVIGLAIGLPAAMAVSRLFTSLLFEVQPTDTFVYVIVTVLLLVVGLTAAAVPARRAARVDPITVLRAD